MDEHILPECFTDTVLIKRIVPPITRYNHKKGCNSVAKEMQYGKLKDTFAVGIIDKDKNIIKYLNEFFVVDEIVGSLILWKHNDKHHFIIQICPELERWLINICREANLNLNDFGLSNDLKELLKVTKSIASEKDARINQLCLAIAERSDLEVIRKLRAWVLYLKQKNFRVDVNELRNV